LIGEDVPETLKNSLTSETAARADIVAAIARLEEAKDHVSRDLLEDFLEETEERIDFYETQIELIAKVGLPNYLQSAVGELSE
jgi:bacterioferritin